MKYKGLFTFDEDNHRYIPIAQADGIIATMGYEPDSKPAEPLIKDEKVRKAVRAWADMHGIKNVFYCESSWNKNRAWLEGADNEDDILNGNSVSIDISILTELKNRESYTIAELCGEEEE